MELSVRVLDVCISGVKCSDKLDLGAGADMTPPQLPPLLTN